MELVGFVAGGADAPVPPICYLFRGKTFHLDGMFAL